MRRHLLITIALIAGLSICTFAQTGGVFEPTGVPVKARAGGGAELAGNILLNARAGDLDGAIINVVYSAPLAAGLTDGYSTLLAAEANPAVTDVEVDLANNQYQVSYTFASTGAGFFVLPRVPVNVQAVTSGNVTATISSTQANVLAFGTVVVIDSIESGVALDVGTTSTSILESGGTGFKDIRIMEGFPAAFDAMIGLELRFDGVPSGSSLSISANVTGTGMASGFRGDVRVGGTAIAPSTGTRIIENGNVLGSTTGSPPAFVATGAAVPANGRVMIHFDPATGGAADLSSSLSETLSLRVSLDATATAITRPIMGNVAVSVTLKPGPPASPAVDPFFTENFIPSGGATIFTFDPAKCNMLFQLVVRDGSTGFNTGLSIANGSDYDGESLSGTILFKVGADTYETMDNSLGTGLNSAGELAAGEVFRVMADQLLDRLNIGDFSGQLQVTTNFRGCRGIGWVTNYPGPVNQAYVAESANMATP